MIPVVLGAVALGTVGYVVKRCAVDNDTCEDVLYDGLDWIDEKLGYKSTSESESTESVKVKDEFEKFEEQKAIFYKTHPNKYNKVISSIQNFPKDKFDMQKPEDKTIDTQSQAKAMTHLMEMANERLAMNIIELEDLSIKCNDFNNYYKRDEKLFLSTYKIIKLTHKLYNTQIEKDTKITKKAMKLIEKLEKLLDIESKKYDKVKLQTISRRNMFFYTI